MKCACSCSAKCCLGSTGTHTAKYVPTAPSWSLHYFSPVMHRSRPSVQLPFAWTALCASGMYIGEEGKIFYKIYKASSCCPQVCCLNHRKDDYVIVVLDLAISPAGHDEAGEFNVPFTTSRACQQIYMTLLCV